MSASFGILDIFDTMSAMGGDSRMPVRADTNLPAASEIGLEEVVARSRPLIDRYLARRVRNPDHRDEIQSRVFEALARSWGSFRGDCPPEAYVLRILANAVKNYYERDLARQRKHISLDVWCEEFCLQQNSVQPGPDLTVQQRAEVESLLGEMRRACSETEGAVVELVYQGHTMDEIATLLGMNPATVRSHFLRGREKLLTHLLIEAPDLLGGMDAVHAAVRRLETGSDASLSHEEAEAVLLRRGPAGVLRRAMLKLAPYLGVLVWFTLGGPR